MANLDIIFGFVRGIIFGIIFLLLWILSDISLGLIGVVIFFAIILFTTFLSSVFSSLFSTSKLPNFKTILPGLLWLAAIIFVLLFVWEGLLYIGCLGPEKFSNDKTIKDYEYKGKFVIQDEALKICGDATVFNSDASDEFWGLPLYSEHPDFVIFGTGKGTIKIVMDNGIQKYEEEVSVDGSFKIKFGTGSNHGREDAVYFIVNSKSLTADKPPMHLDTYRPYSVEYYFKGAFTVFEIDAGE